MWQTADVDSAMFLTWPLGERHRDSVNQDGKWVMRGCLTTVQHCLYCDCCIVGILMVYCCSPEMGRITLDAKINFKMLMCLCFNKCHSESSIRLAFKIYKEPYGSIWNIQTAYYFESITGCGCYKVWFICLAECLCSCRVKSQMVKEKEVNLEKLLFVFKSTDTKPVWLLRLKRKVWPFVLVLIRGTSDYKYPIV